MELQAIVNSHVGSQTQALCKSSRCSLLLTELGRCSPFKYFKWFIYPYIFMYTSVLPTWMSVHHGVPAETEMEHPILWNELWWFLAILWVLDPNLGHLWEHPVLSTSKPPSLQPCVFWGGRGGGGHEILCKSCRTFCFLILTFLMSITSYFVEFPEIWVW